MNKMVNKTVRQYTIRNSLLNIVINSILSKDPSNDFFNKSSADFFDFFHKKDDELFFPFYGLLFREECKDETRRELVAHFNKFNLEMYSIPVYVYKTKELETPTEEDNCTISTANVIYRTEPTRYNQYDIISLIHSKLEPNFIRLSIPINLNNETKKGLLKNLKISSKKVIPVKRNVEYPTLYKI